MQNRLPFLVMVLIATVTGALDARAWGRLFVSSGTADLQELDPSTGLVIGTITVVGSTGSMAAFAYDRVTDTIYMSNVTNDTLWRIDYHAGTATLIGPYNLGGADAMNGLAVDDTGQIFGYSSSTVPPLSARFFRIDSTTGAATAISSSISAGPGSLEFVEATQTMYLASGVTDELFTIDRATGATTLVGPFGIAGQVGVGLAYDPSLGMYAVNNTTALGLYTIDLATGAATLLTAMTGSRLALTFVDGNPTPSTPSSSFCTGNALGTCLACGNNGALGRGCANSSFANGALLESIGLASLTLDTLVLRAWNIPGPGLFFQATHVSGGTVTFGDGMLCATVGIIRLGVVFPTAGIATYPGGLTPNPISFAGATILPGDVRHYQCWYRDAAPFCSVDTFNLTQGRTLTWAP